MRGAPIPGAGATPPPAKPGRPSPIFQAQVRVRGPVQQAPPEVTASEGPSSGLPPGVSFHVAVPLPGLVTATTTP